MLLSITSKTPPAGDLGYLLHKNPARPQEFSLSFGRAHVFYPEATHERCTATMLVEVDPIELVRGRRGTKAGGMLDQYVNDRPYAASSLLTVAISRVYGTAMGGRSKERQELAESPLDLEATIAALPCRGGEKALRDLFEPLGYEVSCRRLPLDPAFPAWGESSYYHVTISATVRLCDLLSHLYVLIPVLDNNKHYWVGDGEVEKLVSKGEGWLSSHPRKESIADRYLKHRRVLTREALGRLTDEDTDPETVAEERESEETRIERPISLNEQRLGAVTAVLKGSGAKRVCDLGCGEGKLVRALLRERQFEHVLGLDVSVRSLQIAADKVGLSRMSGRQRERVALLQGSLVYRDKRIEGFDAAAVVEVIEHMDPPRLAAFERVLFEFARPQTVVLTTPNREYNVEFEGLPAGKLRHRDHRFEWTPAEFEAWANAQAARFDYAVRFMPVGTVNVDVGAPTQMAVFQLTG
jgi:3' terminal RNA ribose 2'-O-methyltransferase Hen1